jgi:sensor histidine kinase YesM
MEILQDVPVFRSDLFDVNYSKNGVVRRNPFQTPEIIREQNRFKSNQKKLTLIIIILWALVQLITFLKNLYIYNILSEPMAYGDQLTKRAIPLVTGILFIFFINYSSRHLLWYKIQLRQLPVIHFLLATIVSILMFISSVYLVNKVGMNTFENSSVLKYFMVEIDRLFLIYLLISITTTAHYYFHELRIKELELSSLEKAYQQSQIISLNNEVNPHMISNTLNNISTLITIDINEAKRMITDFAHLLRQNLKHKDSIYTTLHHERKFIRSYVNLQNIHAERKYKISFRFPEELASAILPKMILQPLVENAIKHGDMDKAELLKVDILAEKTGQFLSLTVKNTINGDKKVPDYPAHIGIGTENIMKRLKVLYRDNFKFDLYQNEKYFTCQLNIPFGLDTATLPT